MRISADWIGVGLCFFLAAALVLGAPLIFPKDPRAEDALRDHAGPMFSSDGKPTIKNYKSL